MNRNYLACSIGLFLACAIRTIAAQAAGPTAGYNIDPKYTTTSPDGTTTIEQYAKTTADGSYLWQFWARRQDKLTLLKPEQADYAAGFRFTNDSQWLVRMQKPARTNSSPKAGTARGPFSRTSTTRICPANGLLASDRALGLIFLRSNGAMKRLRPTFAG